jgi:hypothetical protein
MQIINGKWVDQYEDPIDERTSWKLVNLGKQVQSIYGRDNITYDRLKLVHLLTSLTEKDERNLSRILEEGLLDKVI